MKVINHKNTHDWNNDKPYEGDLLTWNGKCFFEDKVEQFRI